MGKLIHTQGLLNLKSGATTRDWQQARAQSIQARRAAIIARAGKVGSFRRGLGG